MNIEKTANIAILGFGREGISTYNYLKKQGLTEITILDSRKIEEFDPNEKQILNTEKKILGEHYLDQLGIYDIIIKTPGISPYHPKILPYRKKLSSQAQIFFDIFPGKIIAVTGTKGKSTTTSLIYSMLRDAGIHVGIIGNIGSPVLDSIENNYDYVVFEMSSYMLDGIYIDPYISVIVNIYPEHLDYHQNFENYQKAKLNIIGEGSFVVYPDKLNSLISNFKNNKISFGKSGQSTIIDDFFLIKGKKIFSRKNVQLIGEHNIENIMAVIAVCDYMEISEKDIEKSISYFRGLPHRLQEICTKNNITFYDDAISTTPESTIAAIRSLPSVNTIFLGGSDRGYTFTNLIKAIIDSSIKNIVFFPDTGKLIEEEFTSTIPEFYSKYNTISTRSMQEAIQFAFKYTKKESICLLSCASPSYSNWKNFEEKGDEFQKYIKEYI